MKYSLTAGLMGAFPEFREIFPTKNMAFNAALEKYDLLVEDGNALDKNDIVCLDPELYGVDYIYIEKI